MEMRLYRGLKEPFDPARSSTARDGGTDFTDCPFTALAYATGRRGTVLVLDVPDDHRCLREELWLHKTARRFMIWGGFEPFVIHQIPAKELRAEVRRKGAVTLPDVDKSMLLRQHIDRREDERPRGDVDDRAMPHEFTPPG